MAKLSGNSQTYLTWIGGLALLLVAWRFPVPVMKSEPTTLLSMIAVLLGIMLGWKDGLIIGALYLVSVIIGLPQLIWGGHTSHPFFEQPLSGLTIGIAFAAPLAGKIAPGLRSSSGLLILACVLGHMAYLACGFAWALQYTNVNGALAVAVHPFLVGAAVKTVAAFLICVIGGRYIK